MAENRDKKVLNVPALRFPEFSNEWSKDTLQNVVAFSNGKAHENCVDENGCYILVNSKFVSTEGSVIKKATLQLSPLFKSQFVMVMSDLPNGKALAKCFYIEEDNIYTLNQRICSFTAQNGNVSRFLMYQINRNKYYLRYDDGINQTNLKKGEVLACPVFIPSIQEQTKIATFIHLLDKRIATQTKIIEKLQSLIKGITILLTTKGEPNTTIAQCLECHSSTLQESEVSHSGLYKVFGANGLVGYTDMPQMNGDAILIIKDGSGVGTTSYAQGEFSVIGTLNFLTAISNYDLRYLYFVLSVFNFQSYKTGMAIPHIYFKDYGNAKIYCPLLSEQKRIANVLGKLESKLCFEQNILASFNLQKRYLLGQMFI